MKKRGCLISAVLLLGPLLPAPVIGRLVQDGVGEVIASILGIGWIFISIPVSLVVFLDWFRTPSRSGGSKMLRSA